MRRRKKEREREKEREEEGQIKLAIKERGGEEQRVGTFCESSFHKTAVVAGLEDTSLVW